MREVEASVGQRLLWLLEHYRGGAGTTNVPIGWRIRGPLDEQALRLGLDELAARHETLRTTYDSRGRRLFQLIHEPREVELAVTDVGGDESAALAAMDAAVRTDIDATQWPMTAALWRIGRGDHLLLINIHHLATDFFSNMILTRDLGWLYDRAVGATEEELPSVAWGYADWAQWQRRTFDDGRLDLLQAFWKDQLAGARLASLPRSSATPPREPRLPEEVAGKTTLDLDPAVVAGLREMARRLRTTMFSVMLAAFYAHLHRLTGERDLSLFSLFTNRARPEIGGTVGFFVNMIVLRRQLDPEAPFTELARASRTTVVRALAHADLPYQMLPPRTIPTGAGDIVFQYLESPPGRRGRLDVDVLDITVGSGRFALELVVFNQEHLMLRCNREFDADWARGFLLGYGELVAAVARTPEATLRELG